jgi:hypothetical protein
LARRSIFIRRSPTAVDFKGGLPQTLYNFAKPLPPAVAYTYLPGRSGPHGAKLLDGFKGVLQVDG